MILGWTDEIVTFVGPRLLNIWNFVGFSLIKITKCSEGPDGLSVGWQPEDWVKLFCIHSLAPHTLHSNVGEDIQVSETDFLWFSIHKILTLFKMLDLVCFLLFFSEYKGIELPIQKELLTKRFLIFSLERLKIVRISCLLFNLLLFNKNTIHKNYQDLRLGFFFS